MVIIFTVMIMMMSNDDDDDDDDDDEEVFYRLKTPNIQRWYSMQSGLLILTCKRGIVLDIVNKTWTRHYKHIMVIHFLFTSDLSCIQMPRSNTWRLW